LLEENETEVRRILTAYQALLSGEQNGEELWRDLKAHSQLGVTGGTLQAV
jgi:putative protease